MLVFRQFLLSRVGLFVTTLLGVSGLANAAAAPSPSVAIVHVSVLSMDRDRALLDQTLVVRGGVIQRLDDARNVKPPHGSEIVDGRGLWVVPGLVDMHSHMHDPADLTLALQQGVTAVLDMGGGSAFDTLRDDVSAERATDPTILRALKIDGPGDDGSTAVVPTDAAEAIAAVTRAKREGFDFVKVYSRLSPAMFATIMTEARRQGLSVIGHAVRSVSLEQSFRAGQVMLAHGEEYLTTFGDNPPDVAAIAKLVDLTRRYGVTVTANLDGIQRIAAQWGKPQVTARYVLEGEQQHLRSALLRKWQKSSYSSLGGSYDAEAAFTAKLVTALHRAGVPILAGTDAPDVPGVAPGCGLHAELEALRTAGFSNYDALASATIAAGAFVARYRPNIERFGAISVGARADLLLLGADPRKHFKAVHTPLRIMARGRWVGGAAPQLPTCP